MNEELKWNDEEVKNALINQELGKEQAKKEFLELIDKIEIYKVLLSKAEIWYLSNDELCDEIEKRIKQKLKKEVKESE